MCLIPCSFKNFWKAAPQNCVPLSLTTAAGNLFLANISFSCQTMTLAVTDFIGMASGHLVAISMHVRRYWNPPLAFGSGPTISMATLSDGTVRISLSFMGLGLVLLLLCIWHV